MVDTSTVTESSPRLGRYPSFDPRSTAFPMRAVLGPTSGIPWEKRVWTPGPILDQGRSSHCVAFGMTAELNATPVIDNDNSDEAHAFFAEVKAEDVAMGNVWNNGASVLAGAKAAHRLGRIGTYRWGYSVEDVVDCLVRKGPVILGTPWYDEMFRPEPSGRVRLRGDYKGGHCWVALGYWPAGRLPGITDQAIECQNSWGSSWGKGGRFFLTLPDLATLLGQYSDALIVTDLRPVVTAPVEA